MNTTSYARLLRHLGIALVFAPEPFTTPFGVACMLAARHLSKQHEANVNKGLREMVSYYLTHSNVLGYDPDGKSGGPSPVNRHRLSEERPILGQITGSHSFEANASGRKARPELHESAAKRADRQSHSGPYKHGHVFSDTSTRPEKAMHHTIDMGWPSRHYESATTAVAHSSWTTTSGDVEGVTHHSVNMGLLTQHYRTGGVRTTGAESRATNTARLRRDRGAAATHTTVHAALRDNNRYYDTLSRRNVIGGH